MSGRTQQGRVSALFLIPWVYRVPSYVQDSPETRVVDPRLTHTHAARPFSIQILAHPPYIPRRCSSEIPSCITLGTIHYRSLLPHHPCSSILLMARPPSSCPRFPSSLLWLPSVLRTCPSPITPCLLVPLTARFEIDGPSSGELSWSGKRHRYDKPSGSCIYIDIYSTPADLPACHRLPNLQRRAITITSIAQPLFKFSRSREQG